MKEDPDERKQNQPVDFLKEGNRPEAPDYVPDFGPDYPWELPEGVQDPFAAGWLLTQFPPAVPTHPVTPTSPTGPSAIPLHLAPGQQLTPQQILQIQQMLQPTVPTPPGHNPGHNPGHYNLTYGYYPYNYLGFAPFCGCYVCCPRW